MLELPKGVWRWLADNARDLARIASATEQIAEEIARIRATLEEDPKEDGRQ
jgi:hypothetical protein